LRVFEIPEGSKTSSGRVIQNIVSIPKDDRIRAYIRVEDLTDEAYINSHYIVFATKNGVVKKTLLEAYSRPRVNGIIALNIRDEDQLIEAKLTDGDMNIMLTNKFGRAIRFNESKLRDMGRSAAGVRGMNIDLNAGDEIIGMVIDDPSDADKAIMIISENGFGKRSQIDEYSIINRGGKGMKSMQITDKTGNVAAAKIVSELDDLLITTRNGIVIRLPISDVRIMGRATQGVKVIRLDDNDSIADVAVVRKDEDEEEE